MATDIKAEIPTIDIAPWLDGSDPNGVVEKVHQACVTYGFMQIKGHQISVASQKGVFECAKKFFALPTEDKLRLKKDPQSGRGYEPLGSQRLQGTDKPDDKEAMRIGREVSPEDPTFGTPYYGANQWPNLEDDEFKTPIMEYRSQVLQLATELMQILAAGLRYNCESVLKDFMSDPVGSLKLLHYPPRPSNGQPTLGAGAHTDFGAITLLLQHPGQEGLEVLHPTTNMWMPVPTRESVYVVNIGDILSAWTGGQYRSATHRVINHSQCDRYSIPFFYDGTMTTAMAPLDGSRALGKIKTVGDHFMEKFATAAVNV